MLTHSLLCKGDFEGKFQTILQAKGINILMNFDFSVDFSLTYCLLTVASFRMGVPSILFDLKIQINYSHFPSIFCMSCQIQCFLHTVDAIPKRLNL